MEQRIKRIIEVLDFNKAEDIETFDLTNKGYIVNNVVIATALNPKHSIALLNHLKEPGRKHRLFQYIRKLKELKSKMKYCHPM